MSLHLELHSAIADQFADRLSDGPTLTQDAIQVELENGIALTIRYADRDAYSLRWTRDGQQFGIDTAPLHRELKTFPNHYHDADGKPHADPITDPARAPTDNVSRLIATLLDEEPVLATGQ